MVKSFVNLAPGSLFNGENEIKKHLRFHLSSKGFEVFSFFSNIRKVVFVVGVGVAAVVVVAVLLLLLLLLCYCYKKNEYELIFFSG